MKKVQIDCHEKRTLVLGEDVIKPWGGCGVFPWVCKGGECGGESKDSELGGVSAVMAEGFGISERCDNVKQGKREKSEKTKKRSYIEVAQRLEETNLYQE